MPAAVVTAVTASSGGGSEGDSDSDKGDGDNGSRPRSCRAQRPGHAPHRTAPHRHPPTRCCLCCLCCLFLPLLPFLVFLSLFRRGHAPHSACCATKPFLPLFLPPCTAIFCNLWPMPNLNSNTGVEKTANKRRSIQKHTYTPLQTPARTHAAPANNALCVSQAYFQTCAPFGTANTTQILLIY